MSRLVHPTWSLSRIVFEQSFYLRMTVKKTYLFLSYLFNNKSNFIMWTSSAISRSNVVTETSNIVKVILLVSTLYDTTRHDRPTLYLRAPKSWRIASLICRAEPKSNKSNEDTNNCVSRLARRKSHHTAPARRAPRIPGRHVAPMGVKFGISPPSAQRQGCRPPKLKFLLIFDRNVEYKRPASAYPLRDFYKICRICTPFQDAFGVKIWLD